MSKIKTFFIFLTTVILIFIFTAPFLWLFTKITGQSEYGGAWGFSGKAYEEGFFISYSFFITLVLTIFGGKKKYQLLAILLGLILLIQVSVMESLIISVGASIVAWLLAQATLLVKKKLVGKQ